MEEAVDPVLQRYALPVEAVSVTEPPLQKVVAPEALIVAAGEVTTVTVVAIEVALHPLTSVTVTV
jgi:hypothetical protein